MINKKRINKLIIQKQKLIDNYKKILLSSEDISKYLTKLLILQKHKTKLEYILYRFREKYNIDILSERENDVLFKLIEGKFYHEIAQELYISTNTVKKHIKNISEKLYCRNRNQIVAYYYKNTDKKR